MSEYIGEGVIASSLCVCKCELRSVRKSMPRGLTVRSWMKEWMNCLVRGSISRAMHHSWRHGLSATYSNQSANERRAWICMPLHTKTRRCTGPCAISGYQPWDCVIAKAKRICHSATEKQTVSVQDAGSEWGHAMYKFPRMRIMQYCIYNCKVTIPNKERSKGSIARRHGIQSNF
jgi:hypothetical protein